VKTELSSDKVFPKHAWNPKKTVISIFIEENYTDAIKKRFSVLFNTSLKLAHSLTRTRVFPTFYLRAKL
jgi:hypothetical protein